jgi:phosphatidylserine decarboxylase
MIHREGYPTIALTLLFCALVLVPAQLFAGSNPWILIPAYTLCGALLIIILQFFRNPSRKHNLNPENILSPADGKVVVVEETEESEYFKDRRIQISVFMSPFNVHVNRNPVSGIVKYAKYHPGLYLVAWHPKSSTENERTSIVIEKGAGKEVLFRQIAGALARRIVYYIKEGDKVDQAGEMGFIKFGSRVDVFLPVGTRVHVKPGDKVTGGVSVLASW